ncbi:unnamed protein product [Enterobius vermicularis]|uniref:Uncharacterized protein n=1 Tax=Enterobius vermicularis TaxID=51028 RepID=A0A0N4VRK6_ENTVE|nr:unnamed protein product [Enterobius vermicularis]
MAVVSRTTVTTTRTTGTGFRSSTVPVWVIKLLTVCKLTSDVSVLLYSSFKNAY